MHETLATNRENKSERAFWCTSSRYAWGLEKGRTTGVCCTRPYPAFLQEVVSTTQTRELLVTCGNFTSYTKAPLPR